ncbi:acyl carrier protein-like protein [Xylaria nigripes]|nr:acyl carrier protein-like protein [Xylaria nigripes]
MFRTAILRSAVAASRVVARPLTTRSAFTIPRGTAATPFLVQRNATIPAVRMYSAAVGLKREEVEDRIMGILRDFDKVNDPSNITTSAQFANNLGLDSLDIVEVVMAIEEEFSIEIPDKDADAILSVNQAVDYIMNQPDAN